MQAQARKPYAQASFPRTIFMGFAPDPPTRGSKTQWGHPSLKKLQSCIPKVLPGSEYKLHEAAASRYCFRVLISPSVKMG